MNFHEVVQYYTDMLQGEGDWLAESLTWTVLRSRAGTLTLNEVARRVSGNDQPIIVERDLEDAYAANAVVLEETGNGVMIVDLAMIAPTPDPDILARISGGAEAWHVSWHTAYSQRMIHAHDGHVLAVVPCLDPSQALGKVSTRSGPNSRPWPQVRQPPGRLPEQPLWRSSKPVQGHTSPSTGSIGLTHP